MLRYSMHRALESGAGLRNIATPLLSLPEFWAGFQPGSAKLVHNVPAAYANAMPDPGRQQAQAQQSAQHQKALQNDPALRRKVLVNSLLYRSRQRGFLEMDLLVGIWAEKQIPNLSEEMLVQFSQVLDQENPDLYKWLTGQEKPNTAMAANAAYQALAKDVAIQLRENIDQSSRAPEGKEWVRGWDDWNKASEEPVAPGPEVQNRDNQ